MDKLLENKLFRICLISIVVIILIMLLIAIFVGSGSKRITEIGLVNAAKRYYEKNEALLPKEKYNYTTLSLSTLISTGYVNPKLEGSNCPSYVTVTNMGNAVYDFNATLMCNENGKANVSFVNKILTNMVSTGSGLYNYNNSYIFRGENPDNYVKLGNLKWRIIGVDESKNIKLIYSDIFDLQYLPWDDRYNKDADNLWGVNDYVGNEKSRLKEYLDSFLSYDVVGENFTGKILSLLTRHNVCIGKVNLESGNTNICSNTLSDQLVSTITINDYVNASLDKSCSLSNSINCQNYNFLNQYGWTINASSENTYSAYFIDDDEGLKTQYTSFGNAVRPVITLRNNVIYVTGSGTELDPYIIK